MWGLTDAGDWDPLDHQCAGPQGPPPAATPKPQVTPGLVLTELRRIGLPSLQARTQPRDKTLVNFATIFYAEPQTFTRTLTLLGQSVDVEATPTSFTWHYGDGSSATTSTPGAPYPAKDVTHSYTDAHTTVQPSVDVTYSARFRVGNGAWQTIPDTVTIAGPAGALRISEATAVLSGEYHYDSGSTGTLPRLDRNSPPARRELCPGSTGTLSRVDGEYDPGRRVGGCGAW